ncbi:MAG: dATP/dGTP pyrophosphohydrolase domain-containing protein [Dehalococcoidia bacterium]
MSGMNDIEYELWLKDQSKSSTAEMQAAGLCSPAPAGSVLLQIQTEIGTWARATFPTATKESWVAHLRREVEELANSHAPDEAADCLILLLGHAHINGYDLLAAALAKMEVNRNRTWGKPDYEGVVEHIEKPNNSGQPRLADTTKKE